MNRDDLPLLRLYKNEVKHLMNENCGTNEYGLLETIRSPRDLDRLSNSELNELCAELRGKMIETVSKNGGHLASNLGVVELTVALHKSFDCPNDKLLFDVGHQCYAHKLLTGRYDRFDTLREKGGITGFLNPDESEYDAFLTGHSSTAVSAGCGFAQAKSVKGEDGYVVCVVGDGALTGGLAYEGLNNAGKTNGNLIVVLNDNKMSISKNVGGIARHLAVVRSSPRYHKFKSGTGKFLQRIPLIGGGLYKAAERVKTFFKRMIYSKTVFEDMGFTYLGPIDGHDLKLLDSVLNAAKQQRRPALVHVCTVKGKGYEYAERSPKLFHGVSSFDIETGERICSGTDYSAFFGQSLCKMAAADRRICAVTAAMRDSTGLAPFEQSFKNRFFDVGIAEQHAVTFCAGLAASGLIPVFAVYSSFLQRAYDQIIHDAAAQKLRVVLAIDRAGIVGEDGITHQGVFDVAFLNTVPGTTVYAPITFSELDSFLHEAVYGDCSVAAVRYPRGREPKLPECYRDNVGSDYAVYGEGDTVLVSYGRTAVNALFAAERLKGNGISVKTVILYKLKPIDERAAQECKSASAIYFFEEGVREGGCGEQFAFLCRSHGFKGDYNITAIDERFIPQQKVSEALNELKLDEDGIYNTVFEESRNEQKA